MSIKLTVDRKDDLASIEKRIVNLQRQADAEALQGDRVDLFEADIVAQWSDKLFKEQWGGMAIAAGMTRARATRVKALGFGSWPALTDESVQMRIPSLLALQRGAQVRTASGTGLLNVGEMRQYVIERGGLLGQESGRWRCLIEFDPDVDVAPVLNTGTSRRDAFSKLVRDILDDLEIGAYGMRDPGQDASYRNTVLEFLSELHTNGWEHARGANGLRTIRLQKHLRSDRGQLIGAAGDFKELSDYIGRQAGGQINLIEVSISDFGPGILDGFLASFVGEKFRESDRAELLDRLIHKKLSSKAGDPNAGLGIPDALRAARSMHGFVSLRTDRHWLILDGSGSDPVVQMKPRTGDFPSIPGTHWQMLYPDFVSTGRSGRFAPV